MDSGTGFYKKDSVYTFDISNLNKIKKHLNDYFSNALLFYNLNNSDSTANIDSYNGYISINESILLKQINLKIKDYNSYNYNHCDDISINIALISIHEYIGHRKFS